MMNRYSFTRSLFVVLTALFVCLPIFAQNRELNPFAFKLSSVLEGDVFTVTYYLNAPAQNVDVIITVGSQTVVYNTNNAPNTQGTKLVKGIYVVPISLRKEINNIGTEFFRNVSNLPWKINVTGGNTAAMPAAGSNLDGVLVKKEYKFFAPYGIDIDTDPYSDNFGMIYCSESIIASSANSKYYSHYKKNGTLTPGIGLFVFDAAFQNMPKNESDYNFVTPNEDKSIARNYNMGLSETRGTGEQAVFASIQSLAPNRIRLSDDGRLFASMFTTTGKVIKELNPKRLSYKTNDNNWHFDLFQGTVDGTDDDHEFHSQLGATYILENASNKFVAAPNIAFDVRGTENNLKLFAVSGDKGSIKNNYRVSFYYHEYPIGTTYGWAANKAWTQAAPASTYFQKTKNSKVYTNCLGFASVDHYGAAKSTPMSILVYNTAGVEYDPYGGFWLCQYRASQNENPSLVHVNTKGTVDYIEHVVDRARGAIRYTKDNEKLIVAGGPSYKKTVDTNKGNASQSIVYYNLHDHTFNADKTKVTLPAVYTKWATLYNVTQASGTTAPTLSNPVYIYLDIRPEDFAWDYAGNLYACASNEERVCAYALPNGGKPVTTPSKAIYNIGDTETSLLTVNILPGNIDAGTVEDNDFPNLLDKYNNKTSGFNLHYMIDAKFQLRGVPATGYRFYQWDDEPIGQEVSSQTTMVAGGVARTAKFGIDAWETKAITPITTEVTFPGVFVQRELDNESYSTICLPFELKTLTGTPYEGASVLKFVGVEKVEENGVVKANMKFAPVEFTDADYMRPGVPYLIKVLNPILGGEEVIFKQAKCPVVANPNPYGGVDVTTSENPGFAFRGILNPATFPASKTNLFLVADNRLASLYQESNVYGMRGYFTVPEGYDASKIQIKIMDKTATSVETAPNISIVDSVKVVKYMWNGKIYIKQGNKLYDITGIRVK